MTPINRKHVVCFDQATSAYKPYAHNLNAEQAAEHAKSLEADHMPTRVLDQKRNHSGQDPKKCRACLDSAKKITEGHTHQVRRPAAAHNCGSIW